MLARYHLPGLFEFYELYRRFLPLFRTHREYFYDWCDIGSLYGAPADCLWGGGRVSVSDTRAKDAFALAVEYNISARLTFSNSLLTKEQLSDSKCNSLCERLARLTPRSGVIVHSELLTEHLRANFPSLYLISSTTKVLTEFEALKKELDRSEFEFVVPDFRFNPQIEKLVSLTPKQKHKTELLVNECCYFGCADRKRCYESVSRKNLGIDDGFTCRAPNAEKGYSFSLAMQNPGFISVDKIQSTYMPMGFSEYKIEGRSLGSALVLEMLLYYMVKPENHLKVREEIYLDSMLDLF